MSAETILVTGANGFIGSRLIARLLDSGLKVRGAVRGQRPEVHPHPNYGQIEVGDIGPDTDWTPALNGVDAVVHLAARVHVMRETAEDPKTLYERINVLGTKALAEAAARSGVRRLVFASTVKVHGSERDAPYTENDPPAPDDAYGRSKAKAEALLFALKSPACVALRPPLVYGPGVKGNFLALMRLADRGLPLPLGLVRNKRSLIHVDNFTHAVLHCLTRPEPLSGPFLLRDDRDLSTPELFKLMAEALGRPARLLPMPVWLLKLAGTITGKSAQVRRLTESLCVDDSRLRATGWSPPLDPKQGVADTARWFKNRSGD